MGKQIKGIQLPKENTNRKDFVRTFKWAAIGATLFLYVTIVLLFYFHVFYLRLSAFMIIGYIFGNWAGGEEKIERKYGR